jgi:arginine decarboxylase
MGKKRKKVTLGEYHEKMVPKAIFFTNGVGRHRDRLSSFELALRDAGIEKANRLIAASIGVARPSDPNQYGYLSEHHSYGETGKKAGEYAEDLAATMLATTLGIELDPESSWNEREEYYKAGGLILKTRNVVQSAEGHHKGKWSTVVACGVFIF